MLGVLNVKQDIRECLQKHVDIAGLDLLEGVDFPDISGLFIDWVTEESSSFTKQAVIIEHYAKKGVPTVLFDRFMGISHQEYMWLSKFNVSFLEPAVINRVGFDFFPQWTIPLGGDPDFDWDVLEFPSKPSITLAFHGDIHDKMASFEKYYVTYSDMFPDVPVVVSAKKSKMKWYPDNIKFESEIDFSDVAFTLVIGSKSDYMKGILPLDIFDIMKQGCMVLLPQEHRFFQSLHTPSIEDERDLDYYIRHPELRFVAIEEVFGNLEKHYPEFTIAYAVEKLLTLL